jgi:hypothetical protein
MENNSKIFNKWYIDNKIDIDTIFNNIILSIEQHNIILKIDYKKLYKHFCIFIFKKSNINI